MTRSTPRWSGMAGLKAAAPYGCLKPKTIRQGWPPTSPGTVPPTPEPTRAAKPRMLERVLWRQARPEGSHHGAQVAGHGRQRVMEVARVEPLGGRQGELGGIA